ncbi:hypothetical protein [Albidovulum sp.]
MEMPKQIRKDDGRMWRKGTQSEDATRRGDVNDELAQSEAEQMKPIHFCDWASI